MDIPTDIHAHVLTAGAHLRAAAHAGTNPVVANRLTALADSISTPDQTPPIESPTGDAVTHLRLAREAVDHIPREGQPDAVASIHDEIGQALNLLGQAAEND